MKALVIGGGIFGVCAAVELSKNGLETDLFEKRSKLMSGATSVNQNRLHLGYHYPRSIATAKQCLEGIRSFEEYFSDALVSPKENYYAISKKGSKTSFEHYLKFCKSLGLVYEEKYPNERILNKDEVAGSIKVGERIINLKKMKVTAKRLLTKNGVRVFTNREFKRTDRANYQVIVNATYSDINNVNRKLGLATRTYRYDTCNVPIVKLPSELLGVSVTIMDGDFYSILPYAGTPYHLYWNVKNSAQRHILDRPPKNQSSKIADYRNGRFVPLMKEARLVDVLRVTKILRFDVELSDERLTDMIDYGNNNFSILSAKINTCVLTARKLVSKLKRTHLQ